MRKLTGLISLFAILLTGTTAISATRHSNQNSRPNNTKKLSTGDTTNRTVTARSATPKQTVTARSATTRGAASRAARTATTAQNVTARTNAQPDDASVAR
ncbi:MAG: hypothetical protein II219_03000, partial [Alphaproteobacteria bacterium]|nr:hypothetical protein [Alphaproteobacteria bacterium]